MIVLLRLVILSAIAMSVTILSPTPTLADHAQRQTEPQADDKAANAATRSNISVTAHERNLAGYMTLGGFIGPHRFSSDSTLGAVYTNGPSLHGGLALGLRLGYAITPALTLEGSLAAIPTSARGTDVDVSVTVLEPQLHARLGGGTVAGLEPFALVGVSMPVTISSNTALIQSGPVASLQAGAGLALARDSGLTLRLDARVHTLPARGVALATFDFSFLFSFEYRFGQAGTRQPTRPQLIRVPDRDGDGVSDDADRCPKRDEDRDGFEDDDGCPDIDDDLDQVLDVADQCRTVPETFNGYRDDDGCPDELPAALRELELTTVRFRDGSTRLRSRARATIAELAKVLMRYRDVKIEIRGHTDPIEASDEAAADDLSQRRAEAVRDALIALGIRPQRLNVTAHGARQPANSERDRKSQARNRRVTLLVMVPKR